MSTEQPVERLSERVCVLLGAGVVASPFVLMAVGVFGVLSGMWTLVPWGLIGLAMP